MATFNAYRSAQGWIVTATVNGREMYFKGIHNGEYQFHRDPTYARAVTAKTASKYLTDIMGTSFKVEERTPAKMASIIREMIRKGWNNDEAILIAERIFRQYESNVMGLSVDFMVKMQATKAECC